MGVFRIHKTKDYTVLSNYHFRDKTLSLKAKGLLSLMLSLPEEWDYSVRGLAALSKDGVESTQSALQELEQHYYLTRTQSVKKGKFAEMIYDVYEQPYNLDETKDADQPNDPDNDNSDMGDESDLSCTENPYTENSDTETTYTENPSQLNTNIIKDLSIKYDNDVVNNNTTINEMEWLKQLWNSEEYVTHIRSIQHDTNRYKNCMSLLTKYSHDEIERAYRNISKSDYLVSQKPNFDWFVNVERATVEKLLEDAYRDWKQHKNKNGQFCNFPQREYDYQALERKLLGY